MTSSTYTLAELGWRPVMMQQLSLEELEQGEAARVAAVHRDQLVILTQRGEAQLTLRKAWMEVDPLERPTVGDWLWIQSEGQSERVLERQTLLKRTAAGSIPKPQLIAANLDTLFIVSSCNADFNPSRLERYLALAFDAGVEAVLVLTKADQCEDTQPYRNQAQAIRRDLTVVVLNALDSEAKEHLAPWLQPGQTVAFVGSSGVGKSTLANTLIAEQAQLTQGIREDDAKGRHTTTSRQLIQLPTGAWIIDTPGMRELKLGNATEGVHQLFDDLDLLAAQCRFKDCHHSGDEGCALEAAVERDELDARRLRSYLKLLREAERAVTPYWRQRKKWKSFSKAVKRSVKENKPHRA